jgi:uncharacterized protein YfaS (alpha-2-macroglobulin family)
MENLEISSLPENYAPADKAPFFKKKLFWGLMGIALFVLIGVVYLFFKTSVPVLNYGEVYRLVPEKVSQSAAIWISLPEDTDKETAKSGVSFDPLITGKWVEQKSSGWLSGLLGLLGLEDAFAATIQKVNTNFIVFQPDSDLAINRHYAVKVDLGGERVLDSDFLAVENPKVVSVFPANDAEAPEDSKITIVFNRPMVPVTTLDELKDKKIPVEITPKTKGKFKWISTNTLQFIPEEQLQGSSNYTIKIKNEFLSMDGLKVPEFESKFKTRNLRYSDDNSYVKVSGQVYDKPLRIYFNQPVDLDKIKKEIKLVDRSSNKEVSFVAEYANLEKGEVEKEFRKGDSFGGNIFESIHAGLLDFFWGKKEDDPDAQTAIDVYPERDRFGRKKFWDFSGSYTLTINKAYPMGGDIILDQPKTIDIKITDIIADWKAISARTNQPSLGSFDPQGYLEISFYEPINLSKSKIEGTDLQKVEYGQKCRNGQTYNIANCEKEEDRTKVRMYFDNNVGAGKVLNLKLKKIVNDSGLQINKDDISQDVFVYKPLSIYLGNLDQTYYKDTFYLKGFYICSNNPLVAPERQDLKKQIYTNLDYQINSFGSSRLVYAENQQQQPCPEGTFATWISGGFMPNSNYAVNLDLNDAFGQNAKKEVKFQTGSISAKDVNIFGLQQTYSLTTPDKSILTFGSLNVNYVNLQICKVSALRMKQIFSLRDNFSSSDCEDYVSKTISLPEKYWINNYFDVDLAEYFSNPIGNYVLALSNPLFRDYRGNIETLNSYLTVTNMAVAEKAIAPATDYFGNDFEALSDQQIQELKNLYWVTDIKSQDPLPGAKISFYDKNGGFLGSAVTDEEGLAFSRPPVGVDSIVASLNGDSTVVMRSHDRLAWAQSAENYRKAYIYTDKPLYRPEQNVYVKGILRIGYDGNYEMFDSSVTVKGYNSKGEKIFEKEAKPNEFGTFDFDFVLDKNSPLGNYRVCMGDSYSNCTFFSVLEYVPAAFEVKARPDKEGYVSKDNANIQIEANYYFGAPADNSEVEYTLSAQNYYFDKYRGDEWYNFGWWDDSYYSNQYYYGDNFISRNSGITDGNGRFTISQKIDLQDLFKNSQNQGSKIIVLDTTVKNNLGQSVSNQQSFIVHAGSYYIGIKTDPYFAGKNQDVNLKIKTVDTNGNNVGENGITADIYKVNWAHVKRQEASGSVYLWEKETKLVKSIKLKTDSNGEWSQKIKLDQEGTYEIQAWGQDRAGNLIRSKQNIYIFGNGSASFKPTNDTSLDLKASKTELEAGEQGELIIESPYPKAKALVTIERGKIFDYKVLNLTGNIQGYKFEAKDDYAPNVYVSVLLQSSDPSVKFGTKEFKINSDKSKIIFDFKSDKQFYAPGDTVTLNLTATDKDGNPLKTEASLGVVDLSVLALKGNPKKDPLVFFYNGFPLTVSTASNIRNGLVKIEAETASKGGSGGGGGDGTEAPRGDFRETAFWQGDVKTDSNGKATISFKLPDNLTTWQAEVLGVTKDTKLGVSYIEFITKKDLMVSPLKPRFIVPGDTFLVGAQIFNQSDNNKKIKVSFSSDTLDFKDKNKEKEINLKRGQSQSVFFQVAAPANRNEGQHSFTISASGEGVSDSVIQTINIRPNLTYEATATAGYTVKDNVQEVIYLPDNIAPDRGNLTIGSSATLAVFLSDALNYLIGYPYGCSEQIASQLKAIAVVKSGLQVPNLADKFKLNKVKYQDKEYTVDQLVDIGLNNLYKNQSFDGGFGMWASGWSDYYITLSSVDALIALKKAGYDISEDSLNKGADYLFQYYNQKRNELSDDDVISLASVLLKSDRYNGNANLTQAVDTIASNPKVVQDKLSAKSLVKLGILLNRESLNKTLDARVNIDSRGAFLEPGKNWYSAYFETSIQDTALYLDSLALGKRETAITDKVIRWLLNSREKNGAWGSTQNTLAVVEAFTDYLNWKKETSSSYVLDSKLNSKIIDTYSFNSDTVLNQNVKTVSIGEFNLNDYNFLELNKKGEGSLYYSLALKYYVTGATQPRDEGFAITREFYSLDDKSGSDPLYQAKQGQIVREHLTVVVPVNRKHVQIEDFIPAGMEIVDLSLATEMKSLRLAEREVKAPEIRPDFKEIRDDRAYIYTKELLPGVYEFDYYLRALVPGSYLQLPAVASEIYNPENFGRTAGSYFTIVK